MRMSNAKPFFFWICLLEGLIYLQTKPEARGFCLCGDSLKSATSVEKLSVLREVGPFLKSDHILVKFLKLA